jgi:hypothetical protein
MTDTKRKVGRPRKDESRTQTNRPRQRVSVGGYRDKLSVHGMDPDYHYRWVLSSAEKSGRIMQLQSRGYEFASSSDHSVGQNHVYKTEDGSSIIRIPADKEGGFLYLMRITKEWYEEDQQDKSKRILNTEYEAVRQYSTEENAEDAGVYGKFEIK